MNFQVMELYRIEGGKLVERWQVRQLIEGERAMRKCLAGTITLRQAQGEGEILQAPNLILTLSKDDRGQGLRSFSAAR